MNAVNKHYALSQLLLVAECTTELARTLSDTMDSYKRVNEELLKSFDKMMNSTRNLLTTIKALRDEVNSHD